MNCSFCAIGNRKQKSMDIKEIDIILKKICKYTDYIFLHIKGEPLYHKNIVEILKLIEKYNFKINLTTNGTLLKKYEKEVLENKNIRQISISLQSSENFKNIYFKKYVRDILELVAVALEKSEIIFELRLWNYNFNGNNTDNNQYILNSIKNKFNVDLKKYDEVEKDKGVKLLKNLYLSKGYEFIWPNLKNEILRKKGTCYGLRQQIGILANGDIVPCCLDHNGDILLGNIFKDDLGDVINSNRSLKIKKGFENNILEEELCKKCGFSK